MANNVWSHPNWTETFQAKTFTITATGGGTAVWTLTLTEDDGSTTTVTYTEDGSPTVAEVATGLYAAWEASTHPSVARIRATNPSSAVLVLTAETKGVPFSVALADNGTGTHTEADTTANIGNNDGSLDRNWSQNDAPDATDDLIFEPGNVHWKYGLNQSSIAITDFKVMKGCQMDFGRFEFGKFHYLRIDPDSFDYRGNGGLCLFNIGSANISPYIESYGSPSVNGRHVVYITGSNIATLKVAKGNVGVGVLDADAATVATILCGLVDNPQADTNLTIGAGTTLTTLTQAAGLCLLRCAATTANLNGGVLTTEGTGAITTVNVRPGTTFYPKSTGTITTLNVWGTCDASRDQSAKTFSTVNAKPGGHLILNSSVTVSAINPLTEPGIFRITYV